MLWDLTGGKAGPAPAHPNLDKLWNDLRSGDAAVAYRTHWSLVAADKQAVPFLGGHLRPVAAPDPKRLAALIGDLADKRFPTRRQASAELMKVDDGAEPALRAALRTSQDLEVRRRIQELLKRIGEPSPERLRQLRAVEVLEHIHTPTAAALLRQLARGYPGASLTRAAEDAWRRLGAGSP